MSKNSCETCTEKVVCNLCGKQLCYSKSDCKLIEGHYTQNDKDFCVECFKSKETNYFKKEGVLLIIILIFLSSCANMNKTTKGATLGGIIGAGVGYAIGGTKGALIGAGGGAVVGGGTGYYMDKQEEKLNDMLAQSEAASIKKVNDTLVMTFKSDLTFEQGSFKLKPGALNELSRVGSILREYPDTKIMIEGYSSEEGTEDYNLVLSEHRSMSAKRALTRGGCNDDRISTIGYGEQFPISTTNNSLNRRVVITIIPNRNQV